ncbi:MAG: CRTAC1 family protein [Planctomycetales bacterium]|nr:CRTAC1 family protein [Planctomycetales bacterium]
MKPLGKIDLTQKIVPSATVRAMPKVLALILVVATASLNWPMKIDNQQLKRLADDFQFVRTTLNDVKALEVRNAEPLLAPRFRHFESYLLAFLPTGACFFDLDNDGRYDEACTTDGFSRKLRVHQLPIDDSKLSTIELPISHHTFGAAGVLPSGCLPGDFDNDGFTDLLVYFWGRTPVVYLNQRGELTPDNFRQVELVTPVQRWYVQSMSQGDVDGDGDLDLVAGCYFPDDAKVLNDNSTGDSKMNHGYGSAFNGELNRLLIRTNSTSENNWFAVEEDILRDPSISGAQWTIATAITDLNGDLLPEVFFLNDHGVDRVLLNRSDGGKLSFQPLVNSRDLVTPKSSTFGQDDYHAMGIDFADINRDGNIDWLISNFGADYMFHQSHFVWINSGRNELYRLGRAPFKDMSESMGLARTAGVPWDVRCADFNNDGKMEVYRSIGFMRGTVNRMPELVEMGMMNDIIFQYPEAWHKFGPDDSFVGGKRPNAFFVELEGRYVDIGAELDFFEATTSRGAAAGDVDLDGRVDLLVTNQRSSSTFFKNETLGGEFLGLDFRLPLNSNDSDEISIHSIGEFPPGGSRPAIGAEITAHLHGGERVKVLIDGGSGYGGKKTPQFHIGLGERMGSEDDINVDVHWRGIDGNVHFKSFDINPGWHCIWLGE